MIRPVLMFLVGAMFLLLAIRRLRQYKLKERYALVFMLLGLPFFVLAAWPNLIGEISEHLGIAYETVALATVSIFLLLLIFELLTIVSRLDRKISVLAQYMGILMERQQKPGPRRPIGSDNGEHPGTEPMPKLSIFELDPVELARHLDIPKEPDLSRRLTARVGDSADSKSSH